jgi:hypothetical protein
VPNTNVDSPSVADSADPILTPREVERDYRLKVGTLKAWRSRRNGGPPWLSLGRKMPRYRASAIESWLAAHQVDGGRPANDTVPR